MNPLKPVRFYGSALPRPRYLDDLAYERVDPPLPVNDSLLRWAKEANWYMGGLSFKRKRLQGKIEGRLGKLKSIEDDGDEIPVKAARKSKSSPGGISPSTAAKRPPLKAMKRKGTAAAIRGRRAREVLETPIVLLKRPAVVHPLGEWGEEDGPSPRRTSPRLQASSPVKPVPQPSPIAASVPNVSVSIESPVRRSQVERELRIAASVSNVSASVEFPVRRRQVERALPNVEDSDSDVNWEEFSRVRDRPVRKSSRVTSIRRSFKEFNVDSDSDHDS